MDTITMNGTQSATTENQTNNKPIVEVLQDTSILIENNANRPLSEVRVKRLAEDIHKYKTVPALICTGEYVILDGHHRLAALEYIQEKYGYTPWFTLTIVPNSIPDDIALYNKEQVSWKVDDWVNFYANIKNMDNYIQVQKWVQKTGWTSGAVVMLATPKIPTGVTKEISTGNNSRVSVSSTQKVNRMVKEGSFLFHENLFYKRYGHIMKLATYIKRSVKSTFAKAVLIATNKTGYDMIHMENKAELVGRNYLNGNTGLGNYLIALEDVYNYNVKTASKKLKFTPEK